jgi:TBC domain-containing protein kinase-like protein
VIDIPPVVRGEVWATVLGVDAALLARYDSVDKDALAPIDGQLDRDIPRCHQVRLHTAADSDARTLMVSIV